MLRSIACVVVVAFSGPPALQAQPPVFQPDLVIKDVSVSSTLPLADGQRLVTVSFRIANEGRNVAAASQTRVEIGGSGSTYDTPGLSPTPLIQNDPKEPDPEGPELSAYVSHSRRTRDAGAEISIQLDVGQKVAESGEQNNAFQSKVQLDRVEENRWLSIGPSTRPAEGEIFGVGRVTTLAIDPQNPDVVYAGARGSGLWKTEDAGRSWFPVADALPGVPGKVKASRATAVMIDPDNRNRVLLASSSGVFESRNGGALWIRLATGLPDLPEPTNAGFLLKRNVIFADGGSGPPGEILYLSTREGVRVSRDGGRTWTTVLGDRDKNPVTSLQLGTSGTSLFAALSAPQNSSSADVGIYEGVGGGLSPQSWHKLQGCPQAPLPAIPENADVWVAQSEAQLWLSFRAKVGEKTVNELWRATSRACEVNGRRERHWRQVTPLDESCDSFVDHFSFLFLHPRSSSIVFKAGVPRRVSAALRADPGAEWQWQRAGPSDLVRGGARRPGPSARPAKSDQRPLDARLPTRICIYRGKSVIHHAQAPAHRLSESHAGDDRFRADRGDGGTDHAGAVGASPPARPLPEGRSGGYGSEGRLRLHSRHLGRPVEAEPGAPAAGRFRGPPLPEGEEGERSINYG